MPCLTCDLAWEEQARISQTSREQTVHYDAFCSGVLEGWQEILAFAPNLAPYKPNPKDPRMLVANFLPTRKGGSTWFDVQVDYSTEVDVSSNPLSQPAQIKIKSVKRMIPALFDVDGNAIVNIAGDMFTDPAPERQITDLIFTVKKNLPLRLPEWITTFPDCVNSDTVRMRGLTCDPGTLYFGELDVEEEKNVPGATESISTLDKGTPYTEASFELHYRRQGWTLLIPNWGYFQLVPVKAQKGQKLEQPGKKPIRLKAIPFHYTRQRITVGQPADYPAHPVFLDADGAAIVNPTFDNIITLEFVLHEKKPFAQLPLR